MSRHSPPAELEFPGADSFLDVVTNIVGILIILIVVIGARARFAPVDVSEASSKSNPLTADQAAANSLELEVHDLAAEIETLDAETDARRREREIVATLIAAADKDLATRREELDGDSRRQYDRRRELALVAADLNQLRQQRKAIKAAPPKLTTVESYPTPLSKPVDGKELHFQLKAGRLNFVPVDDLVNQLKAIAREKANKLNDTSELIDTIGPTGGFYLRYTLERNQIPWDTAVQTGRGGFMVELARCEFLPTSGQQGETLDQALSANSEFRAKLDLAKPGQWTITLWTYPDSFDEFRRLRKELYELGFATAARPLPDGQPIGASPHGSKSAAE